MAQLACVAACGPAEPDFLQEEAVTAEDTEAIGESACAGASPNQVFSGFIHPYVSPTTYSSGSCYKAVIVDSNNSSGVFGAVDVEWFDTRPTTRAACESLWLQGYYYDRVGSSWVKTDVQTARGVWQTSSNWCQTPAVTLRHDTSPYRITASARVAPTTPAATRKLRMCEPCHILPPPPQ